MLYDDPEPNVHELKNLVDTLCRHLRELQGGVADADMRSEVAQYLASLEDANRGIVAEFNAAKDAFEAAQRRTKEREEELRKAAAAPPAPTEEDVLPLGLALRSELLRRYAVPPAVRPTPAQAGEVGEMTTGAFRAAEAGPKPQPPPKPAPRPPRPAQKPSPPASDDVSDLTSGEWRSQDEP